MTKEERKANKIKAQIEMLEMQLKTALHKKSSSTAEIDVGAVTRKIADLRKQLGE